jgi:hypothetical protein
MINPSHTPINPNSVTMVNLSCEKSHITHFSKRSTGKGMPTEVYCGH